MSTPSAAAERHRLLPHLALRDLDDAAGFVAEMGVVLQSPDPWLPSLFGAAQGAPARPGAGGFGDWPAHAWWWAGALGEHDDILLTKMVRGKRTLVHRRLWPVLDAAVRSVPVTEAAEQALLEGLTVPARSDTLDRRALAGLERRGRVLSRPVIVDNHRHVALVERWEFSYSNLPATPDEWVAALLHAAGPVPEKVIGTWFPWPRASTLQALARLEAAERITREGGQIRPRG